MSTALKIAVAVAGLIALGAIADRMAPTPPADPAGAARVAAWNADWREARDICAPLSHAEDLRPYGRCLDNAFKGARWVREHSPRPAPAPLTAQQRRVAALRAQAHDDYETGIGLFLWAGIIAAVVYWRRARRAAPPPPPPTA